MSEPQLLGDRYELGEVIGRGGMAEVRRGRDTRLGRIVALKMLRVDHAADATFQARFRREAQSAASLNHRNIVAVYDTGEDMLDGHRVPYIVMEYVEGQTLREMVRDQARFTPERSIEVLSAMLDALEYSHRGGIVHRDIKPGNIMITTAGEVKVMDFGIARSLADTGMALTQTAAVVGTAQYISPEQARGEQADARSDLYASGCVLYELLTGRPPFVGESLVSVAVSHVREMATPPSALDPSIPPDLDAIVMKSLAKSREERYQSAYEMRADLQRAAAGLPVAAYADTAASTQLIAPAATAMYNDAVLDDDTLDREPEEDDDEPKGVSWWAVALGTLAVLAIAGLIGFLIFRSGGTQQVTVPSVRGETQQAAEEMLTGRDLVPVVESEATDNADEVGNVISQNPPPNSQVDEGSNVTIVVGAEPDSVEVPRVNGRPQEQAEQMITEAGLRFGSVDFEDNERPAGEVLRTDPEGGALVPPGTTVNLVISTGEVEVEVPDLVGLSRIDAESELARLGLEADAQAEVTGDVVPDEVFRQSPEEGETVEEGGTVTFWYAEAPPEEEEVEVPNLVGMSRIDAESELARLGLEADAQSEVTGDVVPDEVFRQSPEEGETVEEGGTVTFWYAEAPPEEGEDPGGETGEDTGNQNGNDTGGVLGDEDGA